MKEKNKGDFYKVLMEINRILMGSDPIKILLIIYKKTSKPTEKLL